MEKWQVVYTKAQPLVAWSTDREKAVAMGRRMRKAGYEVSLYLHRDSFIKDKTYLLR